MIYFVQESASGNIKIGQTANSKSLRGRLISLRTGNSSTLRLLGTIAEASEPELHDKFAAAHVRGEWFEPCPELIAFIQTHAQVVEEPNHLSYHRRMGTSPKIQATISKTLEVATGDLLRAARSAAAKAGAARAKAAGTKLGRPETATPGRSTRYRRAKIAAQDFLSGL
jgi:hypothetical protein